MKALRLEERNHFGPARSIRPCAVNQDNIFGALRGVCLSECSHVESGRQSQHRGCDQNGSAHLREFHFYLLVKLTVAIKPEQTCPCNWTMVSPILSYRWPPRNARLCPRESEHQPRLIGYPVRV